jgi:leucyl aminopeptidase
MKNTFRTVLLPMLVMSHAFSHSYNFKGLKASGEKVWITTGTDSFHFTKNFLGAKSLIHSAAINENITLMEVDSAALDVLGEVNHEEFNRCAGYMQHDSKLEAVKTILAFKKADLLSRIHSKTAPKALYDINQQTLVKSLLPEIKQENILATIKHLSSYKNRYYQTASGVEAAKWIAQNLKEIAKNRSDISVDLFTHRKWKQPSVIATIKGESPEVIVIGGHLDSISGYFGGDTKAPGADDNASGIATWTEVFRVLVKSDYKPKKTLQFMGYAGEEKGLLGSQEIAAFYRKNKTNVLGVVQLDMTNFKGAEKDIYLMTDFTNAAQNNFIGALIDTYVKVPWGLDKCGYGCSDHASWHKEGYPASMPFESSFSGMNHAIHTPNDTLKLSGDNASHAMKFAKMSLAFAVEMDR